MRWKSDRVTRMLAISCDRLLARLYQADCAVSPPPIHSDSRHLSVFRVESRPTITQLRSIDPQQPGILHLSLLPTQTHTHTHIYCLSYSLSLIPHSLVITFLAPLSVLPIRVTCTHAPFSFSVRGSEFLCIRATNAEASFSASSFRRPSGSACGVETGFRRQRSPRLPVTTDISILFARRASALAMEIKLSFVCGSGCSRTCRNTSAILFPVGESVKTGRRRARYFETARLSRNDNDRFL